MIVLLNKKTKTALKDEEYLFLFIWKQFALTLVYCFSCLHFDFCLITFFFPLVIFYFFYPARAVLSFFNHCFLAVVFTSL